MGIHFNDCMMLSLWMTNQEVIVYKYSAVGWIFAYLRPLQEAHDVVYLYD